MKPNLLKAIMVLVTFSLYLVPSFAQSPEKMSYQAVIRDVSDNLITDTEVGMQISILQGSESGTAVYVETQTPTTNANGLVSIEIGAGTVEDGDFSAIDWTDGPYFIKTETDHDGATSYTITGTSQLLSVPYALHAKTADSVTGTITETDPEFTAWDKSTGILITESQISDLSHTVDTDTHIDSTGIADFGYVAGAITTETDPSVPSGTQTGEMQYWDGSEWITVQPGTSGEILLFINGKPTWGIQGMEDGDVYNPTTGKIWMDKNLGASQVATASDDEDAYGDLYQWGRAADGHEDRMSAEHDGDANGKPSTYDENGDWDGKFITTVTDPYDWLNPQEDNLWQGVSGINNPCPTGYRLPTEAEWEAEYLSWSSQDAAGAFASPLKLPVAGRRLGSNGIFNLVGSRAYYWSGTADGTESKLLYFYSDNTSIGPRDRADGNSVRCIKD